MYYLTSNSMRMMERSLDYLWTKQTAHLDNIANAETPGYKPKIVSFEQQFDFLLKNATSLPRSRSDIRRAIETGSWTVTEEQRDTRMDDNGVNVTEESLEAVRNAYQMQYVMQSISTDFAILKKAIGG